VSNGIDFVIGGKDQAKPAMSAVEKSLERLEQKTDKLGVSTLSLTKLTVGITAAYGAFRAAMGALSGLSGAIDDFDAAQEATRALNQAMEINGGASDELAAKYGKLADAIEAKTNVAAEEVQSLMKQAAVMGVSNDQIGDMATAAVGLSEALGTSLETSLDKVRLATEGNFKAFEKTMPALKEMATDEEKLAAVLALSARGLEMKEEASKSASGSAEQMSHRVGNLMEIIGGMLSPVRQLINHGITVLADAMSGLLAPAAEYVQSVFANMGPMMDYVKEKVVAGVNLMVGAFTFFEVVIGNLDKIWVVMVSQAELYLLQMSGAVMHALTEVIPAYASWFAENFVNLIRDGLMLAFTVVTNHVTKIIDAFRALWDFIASGGTTDVLGQLGDIAGRSYLEGFESSLTDLPEIAGRKISEREKQLADTIGQIGSDLGEEFSTKFAERMVGMGDGLGDELDKDIDLKMNAKLEEKLGGGLGGGSGAGQAMLQAAESRLLTRGPAEKQENYFKRIAESSEKTNGELAKVQSELAQIRAQLPQQIQLQPVP
jgi:hypothetical protein